jgi:hypothetical protein
VLVATTKILAVKMGTSNSSCPTALLARLPCRSLSPTFYEQLLCQNPFAKKLQAQIVST